MLKRLKSVSMLLFLMGTTTGAAYAVPVSGITDVEITQQSETCTGVVKDGTGETVIGASVIVKLRSVRKRVFCLILLILMAPIAGIVIPSIQITISNVVHLFIAVPFLVC